VHRLSSSFILGYHGCSADTAEQLLSAIPFEPSENDYDWLGPGIYFWQENPMRALQYACEKKRRDNADWAESVVGAVIDLGLCLDLAAEAGIMEIKAAYDLLANTMKSAGKDLPSNRGGPDRLVRRLDCAVVRQLHELRKELSLAPIDTVRGIFIEGGLLTRDRDFTPKRTCRSASAIPA
jgi:hypothetical protein